ncbi:MAG TPA: glycosyltransferase family 4 protein [Burkholderiales bacterium]|nr:glycosyltransferase family 4 protein [Burkholderiales bacterium]
MTRLCVVVATPLTVHAFLREHLRALAAAHEVTVVANTRDESVELEGIEVIHAPVVRQIAPLADLRALAHLYRLFRRGRYHAVHSVTPKAGLLAMLASRFARVPVRVHTFTGQVWATRRGAARGLLKLIDKLIARSATAVLVDSPSQRDFLRDEGVLTPAQGEVLGNGSIAGVDAARFKPNPAAHADVRTALAIPAEAIVFIFVGRLTRDKGVFELARAFSRMPVGIGAASYLVLVGPDEERLAGAIQEACADAAPRIRLVGRTDAPEDYLAAADIFCLPSYREGFGAVVIEAAAAGLPAIASRIYGLTDAVEENVTGLLVEPRNAEALAAAMQKLAWDAPLRRALGEAARTRALRDFDSAAMTAELVAFYARALAGNKSISADDSAG